MTGPFRPAACAVVFGGADPMATKLGLALLSRQFIAEPRFAPFQASARKAGQKPQRSARGQRSDPLENAVLHPHGQIPSDPKRSCNAPIPPWRVGLRADTRSTTHWTYIPFSWHRISRRQYLLSTNQRNTQNGLGWYPRFLPFAAAQPAKCPERTNPAAIVSELGRLFASPEKDGGAGVMHHGGIG